MDSTDFNAKILLRLFLNSVTKMVSSYCNLQKAKIEAQGCRRQKRNFENDDRHSSDSTNGVRAKLKTDEP